MVKLRLITLLVLVALMTAVIAAPASAFVGTGIEVGARNAGAVKSGLLGKKLTFTDGDFKRALAIDDFDKFKITSLPSSVDGTLLLAGRRVREGQEIKRRNIAAMVFVPADAKVEEASFGFSVDGGDEYIFRMRFLAKINYAPKLDEGAATSVGLTTQENISVWGEIDATDPEGDGLEYIAVRYPEAGRLEFVGTGGRYKYTPNEGFIGYDSFTYTVRDEYGNYTEACEVVFKVTERTSAVVYADMTERSEYNAAVAMNALGVMSGKQVGDDMYFMPEETVSRAEFVAMALKAAGIRPEAGESFFDDSRDIPTSLSGYVRAAARRGIVDGERGESGLVFAPLRTISVFEAAGIMSRILGVSSDEAAEYSTLDGIPVWARGDVEAMVTLGIIDGDTVNLEGSVTRADAAEFLYRMVNNS